MVSGANEPIGRVRKEPSEVEVVGGAVNCLARTVTTTGAGLELSATDATDTVRRED